MTINLIDFSFSRFASFEMDTEQLLQKIPELQPSEHHHHEFIDGYPGELVPYTVLSLNCITFFILRKILFRVLPSYTHLFLYELIATLELCTDCAELGVIFERHGTLAYFIGICLCSLWWCQVFGEGEACPNSIVEDWLLSSKSLFCKHNFIKLFAQGLGAFLTANYLNCIWCFHLTEQHKSHHLERCETALQVPMIYGAMVEAMVTFISRYIALHSEHWHTNVANYTNSIVTAILCVAALDTSGGFFNPILASALTLNCKGESQYEHFVVYWLGSFFGSIVARWFFILKQRAIKLRLD